MLEAVAGEVFHDKGSEEQTRDDAGYLYPAGYGWLLFHETIFLLR